MVRRSASPVGIRVLRAQSVHAVVPTRSSPSWTYRARSGIYTPGSERSSAHWKEEGRAFPRESVAKLGFFALADGQLNKRMARQNRI